MVRFHGEHTLNLEMQTTWMKRIRLLGCALVLVTAVGSRASADSTVLEAGAATVTVSASRIELGNGVISAEWTAAKEHLGTLRITDRLGRRSSFEFAPFSILLKNGAIFEASDLQPAGAPARRTLTAAPDASCLGERFAGIAVDFPWKTADGSLSGTWSVVLRDGSNYVRQVVTITAGDKDQPISRVEMIDLPIKDAAVVVSVQGSPIVGGRSVFRVRAPDVEQ